MRSPTARRHPRHGSLLRRSAKAALRGYGIVTSPLRSLPGFLIIGAKRGGTTSMFSYLSAHPDVATLFPGKQNIKGVHFFDTNHHRGVSWYRSHFPIRSGRLVVGEASPYYLAHPHAARRAREVVPDAGLILLLRNPVDRAHSHHRERVRNRAETLSFEEALEREPERLAGEVERMLADESYWSREHEHHGYLAQGRYDELLPPWLARFPRDRFLILRSEALYRDPGSVYGEVLRFLGLREFHPGAFPAFNLHPSTPMKDRTRERLLHEFAPHNRRLEELLGMDLSDWDR